MKFCGMISFMILIFSGYFSLSSDAVSGWAGWALAHSTFGVSVNPIQLKGADFAKRIRTACPPNQGITDLLNIFKLVLSLT